MKPFVLYVMALTLSSSVFAAEIGNLEGDVQVSQGKLSYSLPIVTPEGINGVEPSLSISYSQGANNSPLGLGFSLSGLSGISRCAATEEFDDYDGGVTYSSDDRYCLDAGNIRERWSRWHGVSPFKWR